MAPPTCTTLSSAVRWSTLSLRTISRDSSSTCSRRRRPPREIRLSISSRSYSNNNAYNIHILMTPKKLDVWANDSLCCKSTVFCKTSALCYCFDTHAQRALTALGKSPLLLTTFTHQNVVKRSASLLLFTLLLSMLVFRHLGIEHVLAFVLRTAALTQVAAAVFRAAVARLRLRPERRMTSSCHKVAFRSTLLALS